jgi:hypothetical protein
LRHEIRRDPGWIFGPAWLFDEQADLKEIDV